MVKIFVDNREIEAADDANLLEILLSEGIDIPYFCWHPAMGSVGACRQCAVIGYVDENDDRGRIVMSCMTPVTDGARFSVEADNAALFRDSVVENLMLNHPHDCPVCEEGGECHLQDMTVMVGHRDRRYRGLKTTYQNQYLGPFIGHEMNRCITCYRCVRFYRDYAGGSDLSAFGSRDRVYFGRAEPGLLENEFAGNLVEVCPTGVFTDKTLSRHYTRKWDLQSSPTVCQHCSLGCNTYTSERYGELRRVHNRYHSEINSYFLCDRGRFGGHHVNADNRIRRAGIRREDGRYEPTALSEVLNQVQEVISSGSRVVGIGSPRASLEANLALRNLVGEGNYCSGMTDSQREMTHLIVEVLGSNLNTPSMTEIEDCDAVIVIGEDITNHAPRLALSLRQTVRNRSQHMANETGIALWHDAAVRELGQDNRSPLVLMTPIPDRLDDIASTSMRLSPNEICEFTGRIIDALDQEEPSSAKEIADTLAHAKRPLVITGTCLGEVDILKAAINLTIALSERNPAAGIVLCPDEANSIGASLIDNDASMEALLDSNADTVIVLENDIATRLGSEDLLRNSRRLIVLDHSDNRTASLSDFVLPTASFAECEGTFVNNEGRAQRSFAAFKAAGDITASHQLLSYLDGAVKTSSQLQHELESLGGNLNGIVACAPDEDFRIEGSKIARMTHRASGRTAMLADISVHEPKQPVDEESALAFTMEGNQQQVPSSLRAFTWSPGWNSNQSIHKFQSEVGGPDRSGCPGTRLFQSGSSLTPMSLSSPASSNLVAQHHIFGSEELSRAAAEIATLVPLPYLRMNSMTAAGLELEAGAGVSCNTDLGEVQLTVLIDDQVADDCVLYPVIHETAGLAGKKTTDFSVIADWDGPADPLRPDVIATDRTG